MREVLRSLQLPTMTCFGGPLAWPPIHLRRDHVNFPIHQGKRGGGLFVWYPGKTTWSLGHWVIREVPETNINPISIKNWMGPNPNGPRSGSCDRAFLGLIPPEKLPTRPVVGGGFGKDFFSIFYPEKLGKWLIQFDEHIFQMGWFNHQLDYSFP